MLLLRSQGLSQVPGYSGRIPRNLGSIRKVMAQSARRSYSAHVVSDLPTRPPAASFLRRHPLLTTSLLGLTAALSFEESRNVMLLGFSGFVRTARVAIATGLIVFDYKYHLKGLDIKTNKEIFDGCNERSAKRLLAVCRQNKGVYTKAAQHIASLGGIVPEQFVKELSVLQDKADHQEIDKVRRIFREDTQQDLQVVFSEFDEVPLAAASLAQVHRARLRETGEQVAVKIQYEDVSRLFETDLVAMKWTSKVIAFLFPDFNLSWVVTEFDENMRKELDFKAEGRNGDRVRAQFSDKAKRIKVPVVNWKYTTKRVLTMEFIEGCKVNDVEGMKKMGLNPLKISNVVMNAFAEMIFSNGFVHCDPHPGNLFVNRGDDGQGQVILLDHGLYRELDDSFRLEYCKIWKAIIEFNDEELKRSSEKLGAGELYWIFPLLFAGRAWGSTVPLGSGFSVKDREALREKLKGFKFADFVDIFEKLPRDLLLVMRTNNLVRSINRDLGGSSSVRYRIFGRHALQGIFFSSQKPQPPGGSALAPTPAGWSTALWNNLGYYKATLQMVLGSWFNELLFKFLIYFKRQEIPRAHGKISG